MWTHTHSFHSLLVNFFLQNDGSFHNEPFAVIIILMKSYLELGSIHCSCDVAT